MPSTVWKGHLTFGLVSIPVKLHRAARPEKVSFRQLHASTGARVRQALMAQMPPEAEADKDAPPRPAAMSRQAPAASEPFSAPMGNVAAMPRRAAPPPEPEEEEEPSPREVQRSEIVKGYEYARDQYVTLTKDELAAITPQTAREMQMLEFVKLQEVDPIYFETSYYVSPDKGGERAYSLLFEALKQSEFVGIAQVAMHNREHVVVIRPGRTGIILHTMFYETEIRRDDEYRADTSNVASKELDLALLLVRNLAAPFEPAKYRDTYREKLDVLIQQKIAGQETVAAPAPKPAPVVNILEALQRSLQQSSGAAERKPPAAADEASSGPAARKQPARRRSGGK